MPKPSPMRNHPRVNTEINVSIKMPDGRIHSAGQIRNISLGGVFIEIKDPPSFGSEFDLEFRLPQAAETFRCRGLVVWNTKSNPENSEIPGMGVRLMQIGVQDMRRLAEYIDSLLAT